MEATDAAATDQQCTRMMFLQLWPLLVAEFWRENRAKFTVQAAPVIFGPSLDAI